MTFDFSRLMKIKLLFLVLIGSAFAKTTAAFKANNVTGVYAVNSLKTLLPDEGADKTYTGSSLTLTSYSRYKYHNYNQLKHQTL